MWKWSFSQRRFESKRAPELRKERLRDSPGETVGSATIGSLADEMKAKGYQGPYFNRCDGITVVMFHGPDVLLEPAWIEPADNVFQMRVLDCQAYCGDSPMFAMGKEFETIALSLNRARDEEDRFCSRQLVLDAVRIPCLLSYPRGEESTPEGAQYVAEGMEDMWNVFWFDDHFYFTRSWTGELRYCAKLHFRLGAMFVTEVQTHAAPEANADDDTAQDEAFAVRQVDFLIKAVLYRLPAPAPLPRWLPKGDRGALALYSLNEYGRWGQFPSFEDTTEYRVCLNGTKGRFPQRAENALLPAIGAVEESDSARARQRLLEELRGSRLYFAFSVPENAVQQGAVAADAPILTFKRQCDGIPYVFGYTDPAFRIEPCHGCMAIEAAKLWSFVGEQDEITCLVINPGGPATCTLNPTELQALAR